MNATNTTVNVRSTFDGKRYDEYTTTVEQARIDAQLTNTFGGMFWYWLEATQTWQLSEI